MSEPDGKSIKNGRIFAGAAKQTRQTALYANTFALSLVSRYKTMPQETSLNRFTEAQQLDYATALAEIKQGRKRSHWMWYIFPQIQGLGFSSTSRYYGIKNRQEAEAYLRHPVLGARLREISAELLKLPQSDASRIFGYPDDLKLKSSMTLFASVPQADPVFEQVLAKYFNGEKDGQTLKLLNAGLREEA